MKLKQLGLSACCTAMLTGLSHGAVIPVTTDITTNTTWTADNIYTLGIPIFVKSGAVLTIEPGTVIAGYNDGTDFGSLVITKGSKIMAQGTATKPIIFTAAKQAEVTAGVDLDGDLAINATPLDPYDPIDTTFDPNATGGYWGGVILLGDAPVNFHDASETPITPSIEGFPGGSSDLEYGGTDVDDDSGVLCYVSIQFGGFEFAANNEINGLTLGGVGSGTTIEFVEVVANTDDGFEFFGGTVNTKYLVSAFNLDEAFDIDQGHQGCHQFWFALQSTSSDNGSELDSTDGGSANENLSPKALTHIFNATYIGGGSGAGSGNDGFRMKDGFAGQFHNSCFHDFGGHAVRVDDSSTVAEFNAGNLRIVNSTFGSFASGSTHGNQPVTEAAILADTGNSAVGTSPGLITLTRHGVSNEVIEIDPRPAVGSTLLSSARSELTSKSCFDEVSYRGAFGDTNWANCWTYLAKEDFFSKPDVASRTNTVVAADITTNTTWTNDTNWILEQPIFVKSGATLTIEAGTYIMGKNDGTDFGSLIITRGSDIIANGTADEPIVFTAVKEAEAKFGVDFDGVDGINTTPLDPNDPIDRTFDPNATGGYWGGVIILGDAPVNFHDASETPITPSIEGFPGGSSDLEYGGNTPGDSSGSLRYVSIQFGGFEFAANNEINGLTLGGVGSGTTIEYVEVVANTDDGFEFFGGTVATKYLVSAFNLDEAFDADQGHTANHQFWYAHQGVGSDNGSELDSTDGGSANENLTPKTLMQVYNATYLGGGPNAGSGNDGFRMKDGFAGQFHNSIFHDFGGHAVRVDDSSTVTEFNAGNLKFNNNIFGDFASGTNQGGATGAATELAILADTGNTAVGTDPCLRGMFLGLADQRDGKTDPRPRCDSPAWVSNGATLSTVPGGLMTVDYRGAFGNDNWADGWTYMSQRTILVNCPAAPAGSGAYGTWAYGEFSGSLVGRGPFDDFNLDGLNNFASYAFGLDPNDATDTAEVVATSTSGTATYKRLITGSAPTYEVFISSSLPFGTTPAVLGVDYSEALGAITGDYQEVTVTILVPASGDRFLKVVATEAK